MAIIKMPIRGRHIISMAAHGEGPLARMTDPFGGLMSFQQGLLNGEISLQAGALDPDLFVHAD